MAVQFCTGCGDLLPISHQREVKCECCGNLNDNKLQTYSSESSSNNFPSELRDRRGVVQASKPMASTDTWSYTDMQCPKCHAAQVQYTNLQLRGADEGSTLFYFCPGCGER
ncbi:hypothetical protein GMORB2_6751 [Geosmithia morbida]|uniref:DNA-directed RNA polymerase subunit n=1 Tax=Geosmithia morbida TaxID=1094350 RepID=A0A9P4YU92_9HYPO|nr:uncharacterized protein GMORB2_6751 [Geosmithia morbida]KAF4123201.1 hypothetical protein GMORB2_6751 [Geosmithia morbida]